MKKPVTKTFTFFILLLCCAFIFGGCMSKQQANSASAGQTLPLYEVYVYGESALLYSEQPVLGNNGGWLRELTLRYTPATGGEQEELAVLCGDKVNQGICLYQLAAGSYTFSSGGTAISVSEDFFPLEGYTLPREGIRRHWRFSEQNGLLLLSVEDTDSLPAGYCDIFIDVGHGGEDTGAAYNGYIEAEQNLRSASYMAQLLEQRGFVVQLSRTSSALPGGTSAENNPYAEGARIDTLYRSGACYLISNHLNAADGQESGFQIYSSVLADTAWAEAVAQRFSAANWYANNSNKGLVGSGIYQRWARDNYHTGRDYYFILRESGGYALAPYNYQAQNDNMRPQLRRGAAGILLEYLFLDNRSDMVYWEHNYQTLVEAAVAGCCDYWQAGTP